MASRCSKIGSMTFTSCLRLSVLAVPAGLAIAACGASSITGRAVTPPPATSPSGPGLPAAMTATDIVNSGFFSQRSDALLGGLASTDARVFTNTDNTIVVEVDLVSDTGTTGAASDYPPYQSAAAKQAGTAPSTFSPALGQQSSEYVGRNAAGNNVASISFVEGNYIAVVTVVGNGATTDVVKTTADSIALAQDNKIASIES